MGRFICLHHTGDGKKVCINADTIIAVMDMRPMHNWTRIDTYSGTGGYCVEETVESVIGLIKQQTDPLDNCVCPVPVNWSLSKEKEE